MVEALYRTLHARSTDPKDKLYALLGLVHDGFQLIGLPNYFFTKEEVYQNFATELLKQGYSLDLLTLKSATRSINADLPSWVVDWSDLNDNLAKHDFKTVMVDLAEKQIPERFPKRFDLAIDGNLLAVKGIIIGHIGTMTASPVNNISAANHSNDDRPTIPSNVSCMSIRLTPTISKHVHKITSPLRKWKGRQISTEPLGSTADAATSQAGMDLQAIRRVCMKRWIESGHFQLNAIGDVREIETLQWDYWELVEYFNVAIELGLHVGLHDGASEDAVINPNVLSTAVIDSKRAVTHAVFGVLAPQSRAGDVLAKIQGCSSIVILREDPRGYSLVGTMRTCKWNTKYCFDKMD